MLRAGVRHPTSPLAVMGLSESNIMRLKDGKPIRVTLESFGVGLPGSLVVFYGKTEADMEADLRKFGLIGEDTAGSVDPRIDRESAARRDYKKILIATVGLPRSGKSTWARSQSYPVVNPDSVRLAIHGQRFVGLAEPFVWATTKAMVRALFIAGHDTVILDATNLTRARRDEWVSKEWGLFFREFKTPKEECLRRASAENDAEIVSVIERMAASAEPLGDDEMRWL